MFRRPKKEVEEKVEIVPKCSFCKTEESIGNKGKIYYCSKNSCAVKLHKNASILSDEYLEEKRRTKKKKKTRGRPRKKAKKN